jgi:hypothetical protein
MPATVSDVAAGLKTNLSQIEGLRVVDYISDQINPPTAFVAIDNVTYHRSFAGGDPVYTYTVTVIVSRADARTAQAALDGFLSFSGGTSIREAIEADTTCNGTAQTCVVERGGNVSAVTVNDVVYLSVDFTVTAHA